METDIKTTEIVENSDDIIQDIVEKGPQEIAAELEISQNAVVDAGAGAGKTTTLAKKVAYLVGNRQLQFSAERIAIMTFTRNAAAELRVRMNKALSDIAAKTTDPDEKRYIREQLVKFRRAPIVTINAFCLDVLKENIQLFDLPANFTLLEDAKVKLLLSEAIDNALEIFYNKEYHDENGDPLFSDDERDMLFRLFSYRDDEALHTALNDIYNRISSLKDNRQWLDSSLDPQKQDMLICALFVGVVNSVINDIDADLCKKRTSVAGTKVKESDKHIIDEIVAAFDKDEKLLIDLIDRVKAAYLSGMDHNELLSAIITESSNGLNFESVSIETNTKKTADLVQKLHDVRDKANSEIKQLPNCLPKSEDIEKELAVHNVILSALIKLLKLCDEQYSALKAEKGCIDFSECEHKLLNELRKADSPLRKSLMSRYDIIIIDEFQDTNDTQYAIFEQLTGEDSSCSLFVVGDVKQSIYAFRGGNPTIMAALCEDPDFKRITLSENYRSRSNVIESVNAVFKTLMSKQYGDVDYTDEVALKYGNKSYTLQANAAIAERLGISFDAQPQEDVEETDAASEQVDALYDTELHVLTPKSKDHVEHEAKFIGKRIKELIKGGFLVSRREGDRLVPDYCTFSDIGILVRTKKHIAKIKRILEDMGIPVDSCIGDTFLETEEIKLVLNYLKIIDNPMRDKEMVTVMMSPLYCMDVDMVSKIKLGLIGFDLSKLKLTAEHDIFLRQLFTTYRPFYSAITAASKPFDTYKAEHKDDEDYVSAEDRINSFIFSIFDENGEKLDDSRIASVARSYEDSLLQFFSDFYKYNRGSEDCFIRLTALRNFYLLLERNGAVREQGDPICKRFVDRLGMFRSYKSNNSVERLVRKLYDDTDMLSIVSIFDNSPKKLANMRMLIKYVAGFESSGGGMLGDFLRYTDSAIKLKDRNTFVEASVNSGSNAVRIMTIHASKGLEMPVVFMAQLGESFNNFDSRNPYAFNRELGLAVKNLDDDNRTLLDTILYTAIQAQNDVEQIGEELRLLYVAMTRAREKLIMTATISKSALNSNASKLNNLDPSAVLQANAAIYWLMYPLLRAENIKVSKGELPINIQCSSARASICFDDKLESSKDKADEAERNATTEAEETNEKFESHISPRSEKCYLPLPPADVERAKLIAENICRRYDDELATATRSRYSVTEVAHMIESGSLAVASAAERVYIGRPEFVSQGSYTGKEIGDAYHHAMQFIPFDSAPEDAAFNIDKLHDEAHITDKEYDFLSEHTDKFEAFLRSELCRRAVEAYRKDRKNLQREKDFFTQVSTSELGLASDKENADVFLQGRIDLYFVEDDGVVLVDYKSDSPESLKKELESYKKQLRMYNDVLLEITGKPVKEIYIYAFTDNSVIGIDPKE